MLDSADYGRIDDPSFKEDTVREEIVAPLVRRLGYGLVGDSRVLRSKSLVHPFVTIGTRSVPVRRVPDYTLYYQDTPVLVLDAKSPSEAIVGSDHVQQAYSYAIHPEVRCGHFALCNGRELVLYDIDVVEPIMRLPIETWEAQWHEVARRLSPRSLLEAKIGTSNPDAGWRAARLGIPPSTELGFVDLHIQLLSRLSDQQCSMSAAFEAFGSTHLASFDFHTQLLEHIVACVAPQLRDGLLAALSRWPFQASMDLMVAVDCRTHLGVSTSGECAGFVPFVVDEITASRLVREPPGVLDDAPSHLFSLRRSLGAHDA